MKPHDEILQRLFDIELPATEANELRSRLSPADSEKLLALSETDGVLGKLMLAESEGIDIWAKIEPKLPVPKPSSRRWSLRAGGAVAAMVFAATLLLILRPTRVKQTNHCDIESLEVAGAVATVVNIPDEGGDDTTMIWVDHQESDEWESL